MIGGIILFLAVCVFGIRRRDITLCEGTIISKKQTDYIKGIAALEIMLGHIGLYVDTPLLFPFRKAGILVVGVFFFLSGYGLTIRCQQDTSYGKSFLVKRVKGIVLPFWIANLVYVVVLGIGGLWEYSSILDLFLSVVGVKLLNYPTWYLIELLFFYVLFWLVYNFLPKKKVTVLFCISIVLIYICYLCKVDDPWYGSALCFAAGTGAAWHEEKIKKVWTGMRYWGLLLGGTVVLGSSLVLFFVLGEESFLGNGVCRNVASITFALLLYFIFYKIQIKGYMYEVFGKISMNIYLYHMLAIQMLALVCLDRPDMFLALVVAVTVLWALGVSYIPVLCRKVCIGRKE